MSTNGYSYFMTTSNVYVICYNKLYVSGDVVPSKRKINIHGSEFKFFVSIFRTLEEIII